MDRPRVAAPHNPSNHSQEPYAQETYGSSGTPPQPPFWRSRNGAIAIGILGFLVLIAIVVGVAVGVTQKKNTSKSTSSSTSSTISQSTNPTTPVGSETSIIPYFPSQLPPGPVVVITPSPFSAPTTTII